MTSEELANLGLRVKPLEWGDPQPPNDHCPSDHVDGFGEHYLYRIEWKSWKNDPGYVIHGGEYHDFGWSGYYFVTSEDSLADAKAAAQAHYAARILSALEVIATPDAMIREAEANDRALMMDALAALVSARDTIRRKWATTNPERERVIAALSDALGVEVAPRTIRAEAAALRGEKEPT